MYSFLGKTLILQTICGLWLVQRVNFDSCPAYSLGCLFLRGKTKINVIILMLTIYDS